MKKGEVFRLDNLFTEEEVSALKSLLKTMPKCKFTVDKNYGRLRFMELQGVPESIVQKLNSIVNNVSDVELELLNPPAGAIYSSKHGVNPKLPTHFDGDFNDAIIDYQLESNTQWPLGVNLETYPLEDNSGVLFSPNANIHWRPRKTFKEDEYITMIFFRFFRADRDLPDYSHLRLDPSQPVFAEVNAYRDSLGS
jgi:hypothetical protein